MLSTRRKEGFGEVLDTASEMPDHNLHCKNDEIGPREGYPNTPWHPTRGKNSDNEDQGCKEVRQMRRND